MTAVGWPLSSGSLTLTLRPGGEVTLHTPSAPTIVVPAGHIDPWDSSSARMAVWVLTDMRLEPLVALRLRLQEAPPSLVIYPQACLLDDRCRTPLVPFLDALDVRGIPRAGASPGQWMTLGKGLQMAYLLGGTERSYPVLLRQGTVRLLLPANIPVPVQKRLAVDDVAGVVWPLPLPQSGTWPTPSFLARLRPRLLLYPSGVTYPPSASKALDAYPLRAYPVEERWTLRLEGGTGR